MDFPCFGAINSFWLGLLPLVTKELTIGAAIMTFSYVENFIYPMKYILLDVNYIHSTKETVANLEDYLVGQVLPEQVLSYPNVTALEVKDVAYHVGELAVTDFSYRFDKGKVCHHWSVSQRKIHFSTSVGRRTSSGQGKCFLSGKRCFT